MDDNIGEDVVVDRKLVRSKGKSKTYVRPEVFVEVKAKTRRGKCVGALITDKLPASGEPTTVNQSNYQEISSDVWYHVAEHIPPEDVLRFALICRQTAQLVNTRKFWLHLYKLYCQQKELSECLRLEHIRNCDMKLVRFRVVQSLFYCYTPLVARVKEDYHLDSLQGQLYVTSWIRSSQCLWLVCHKFRSHIPSSVDFEEEPAAPVEVVNDWESLVNLDVPLSKKPANQHEGSSLLLIYTKNFIPLPTQLLYENEMHRVRLKATRQMLTKDLLGSNLELDFMDSISKFTTTVKYPMIVKFKVLPWWHPYFKLFT